MELIRDRIRELRINKNLSSKDLCTRLDFNPSTYSNLEKGKKSIDTDELTKISEFYNVSAYYILGIDKPKNDTNAYMKKNKELDDNDIKEIEMILSMMDEAIAFNDMRNKI
jgi:transcriptional regulator with XRE-family HTH domain